MFGGTIANVCHETARFHWQLKKYSQFDQGRKLTSHTNAQEASISGPERKVTDPVRRLHTWQCNPDWPLAAAASLGKVFEVHAPRTILSSCLLVRAPRHQQHANGVRPQRAYWNTWSAEPNTIHSPADRWSQQTDRERDTKPEGRNKT